MPRRELREAATFDCGDGAHQIVTLNSNGEGPLVHRVQPCEQCPWRTDVPTGVFPASAYRHSAATAYDMAQTTFACHMSGKDKPATCAGFLLRGSDHNLSVRLALTSRRFDHRGVSDGGVPLFISYRAMAVANGVSADDPALAPCRGADEDWQQVLTLGREKAQREE